jgi:D-alanyl-D-alanine carboxypeptidase/D-alanyl-D-alanine-endopeptidase (penicillin-binding protein 4)
MAASLSIFGADGTTKKRPKIEQLGAYVRAKTGSLDDVKALTGYIFPRNAPAGYGRLVFAVIINQPMGENWRDFQNDIIEMALQRIPVAKP